MLAGLLANTAFGWMLRIAASLKYGHATASLVVGKLHAASRRSAVAQALVEYGAIQRTLYSLRYLADEAAPHPSVVKRPFDDMAPGFGSDRFDHAETGGPIQ